MKSHLVNVRLDDRRVRRARRLRARGIILADLVREAIDRRYDELMESVEPLDVGAIMKEIYEKYPDPADLPVRKYDVHDRREARDAIVGRLRKRP